MSKKDYIALARAIYVTTAPLCCVTKCGRPFVKLTGGTQGCPVHGLRDALIRDGETIRRDVITAIAGVLEEDSSRFDRARFLEACETGSDIASKAALKAQRAAVSRG